MKGDRKMIIDDKTLGNESVNKEKGKRYSKKKFIFTVIFLISFILLSFLAYKIGREEAKRGVKTPEIPKTYVKREKKTRRIQKREVREIRFQPFRDVFKEFYTERFIRKIENKIRKNLEKEFSKKFAALQNRNKTSLPDLKEVLLREIRVIAIICTDKCYALTNRGILRDGENFNGYRVRVSLSGIRLES